MKAKLFLFFLFTINVFGYNNPNITDYINIKGTRLSIIPPKGFTESKTIIGLEKGEIAVIQIMDLVGGNFESNTATYTKAEFERKGLTVLEFKELTIDGFKAKFSNIKGKDNRELVQIVFGDATFSVMVNAIYPSNLRDELLPDITNSLLKVKYDKKMIVDPFSASHFLVDPNTSKFKFAKASANMFVFSENGIDKVSYENEPIALITSYPFDKTMTKEAVIESMVNGLLQQRFIKKEIKNTSKKNINGYEAMEIELYLEHNSKDKLAFMTVLIKDNIAISFSGVAESNFEENISEFKKLTNAIKIK